MIKQRRPIFVLELRPEIGVDAIRALRSALKNMLRRHGLRCLSATTVTTKTAPAHLAANAGAANRSAAAMELIMTRDEIFPSKYLRAPDLQGRAAIVEIERAPVETLKNAKGETQQKAVLHFRGRQKALPLNMTNYDSVSAIAGTDETDAWAGTRVELFPTRTTMGGRMVDCIRIRRPAQHTLPMTPPAEVGVDLDGEEIPF